jgi:hypothetical protein
VETVTTDAQGIYDMPVWRGRKPSQLQAFKPGYVPSPDYFKTRSKGDDFLQPLPAAPEERLQALEETMRRIGCDSAAGTSNYKLYPIYRAIFDIAKATAGPSRKDQELLERMRGLVAMVWSYQYRWLSDTESRKLEKKFIEENLR